jgi:hypothetical protein
MAQGNAGNLIPVLAEFRTQQVVNILDTIILNDNSIQTNRYLDSQSAKRIGHGRRCNKAKRLNERAIVARRLATYSLYY